MSFTGRIRLYLVAIALLPPLLMMAVVYFYSSRQTEINYHERAAEDLRRLANYRTQFRDELGNSLENITQTSWLDRSVRLAERGRSRQINFDDLLGFGLDFYELLDPTGQVVASHHRPGLVGEAIELHRTSETGVQLTETTEFDISGRHAALSGSIKGAEGYRIHGGSYLEHSFLPIAEQIARGRIVIQFLTNDEADGRFRNMDFGSLYRRGDRLETVLMGGASAGYVVRVDFEPPDQSPVFSSFMDVISLVALVSVLAAVGLGVFISSRARREFDNLIDAFTRVSAGDLSTAVMAYTEGEFARLAESFSEMTQKLRRSQAQLATAERIAAWQAMARKIAHEIKNPLTPIGISADDLRRSYQENLPGFADTLDRNTRTIRSEINRLTRLLDEFVSFARMRPPEIKTVDVSDIMNRIKSLYADAISKRKLRLETKTSRRSLQVDGEMLQQLIVNLIKNGLEAGTDSVVTVVLEDDANDLVLTVTDTGPGFSEEILDNKFQPYLSTKKDGSGLGLVICQRIAHDHGGQVELSNNEDGGAKVTVSLPQA